MILDGSGKTLGQLLTTTSDEGLLALTIFNEANPATLAWVVGPNLYRQQDAIAASIFNRYSILNGSIRITGVPDVSTLGWGPAGASIREVIASGQYEVIQGNAASPRLSSRAQRTTDVTLDEEQSTGPIEFDYQGAAVRMTSGCFALWQSYITSLRTLAGQTADPFRVSGSITTSFNSDPTIRVGQLENRLGTIGGNTFFGIPESSIAPPPTRRRRQR
jgi:hypothetical protein